MSEATYRTPVFKGELSEQDRKGLDLAIEQAAIGLSEGVSSASILIASAGLVTDPLSHLQ
jgi:hypothetical protein